MHSAFLGGLIVAMAAAARPSGTAQEPPASAAVGAPLTVRVVNVIPKSLSGETNQDSEPFLAVSPGEPRSMAASAFTPNPAGTSSGKAPIFVTRNGGTTWRLNLIVPSSGSLGTSDITHGSARGRNLYAGILRVPGSLLLNELFSADFLNPSMMTVQASRTGVDQPFVRVAASGASDRVYVGNNDFGAPGGRTATIDVSANSGVSFNSVRIESRATSGQDGPSVRPTIAKDGTVYAAFFGWRSFNGTVAKSDVVVVRDDTGIGPFTSLVDPGDGRPGRRVAVGVAIPWSNAPTLGQERIGSTLSIAVAPTNSKVVYVAWCDRTGSDIYTAHVRRSTDGGLTWSGDRRRIKNATNVALAVSDSGVVGLLYQQLAGTAATARYVTHLEQTKDGFATRTDTVLSTVPANTPPFQFLPYLGDYDFLLVVGSEFRGIFSANNTPDLGNFPNGAVYQRLADFGAKVLKNAAGGTVAPSIDPFYFTVSVLP